MSKHDYITTRVSASKQSWVGDNSRLGRVITALESAGCGPVRRGSNWQARCPVHDDRHPSLSVKEGRDGRVLLRCWSGCETHGVLKALGLGWPDLFPLPVTRTGRGV
jgi:hypothetical protein